MATLYICRESFTNPTFFEKTNPILCVIGPKTEIRRKNEPKTNPNEPNFYPVTYRKLSNGANPILTQKATIRGVYPDLSGQIKPNQTQFQTSQNTTDNRRPKGNKIGFWLFIWGQKIYLQCGRGGGKLVQL